MSSAGSQFEEFARDCVKLAGQAKSPELREKLFAMAREWMRAVMDEQDAARRTQDAARRTMPEVTTQRKPESAPHKMNPA
jgi:hypothetical protein